jgi:hypothetical protein
MKDLNVDFSTCESIVLQGTAVPVEAGAAAGEVRQSLTSTSINGRFDKATGTGERHGAGGAGEGRPGRDRIVMSTLANAGTFVFCPIPAGTYDIVTLSARRQRCVSAVDRDWDHTTARRRAP